MSNTFVIIVIVTICVSISNNLDFECHDDTAFDPPEGLLTELQFTWLGTLQYIHIKNGTPHYFRMPRVLLISRQYVIGLAADVASVPDEYSLGNVVFIDYERDEKECNLTPQSLSLGAKCEPATLVMPIVDVLVHPEYKHFEAKNSIALLKLFTPVKSNYMLPVCLPFNNFVTENGTLSREKLYFVDYIDSVPRDFMEEAKSVKYLSWIPKQACFQHLGKLSVHLRYDRKACTSGCGLRAGAPLLVHEHTGHWTLVAITEGDYPCPDPLIGRNPGAPPRHLLIYPYMPWISGAITGQRFGFVDKYDPFGFAPRARTTSSHRGWAGHWWLGGKRCYDRGPAAQLLSRFYHEVFEVEPSGNVSLTYYVQIDTAGVMKIVCVKVYMPYQLSKPLVWELGTPSVKVLIPPLKVNFKYRFQIEAWGYNTSFWSFFTQ